MLEHPTGMIGLPLRLLAREIYDRVTARIGEDRVALVTGEEKRVPRRPDYWVCTTEAMPLGREVDFLAVDEVQLATHEERGHVFTDRLLFARGRQESWFLGAGTMRGILERLVPAAQYKEQARLSRLSFAGSSKLSKLPPRSAVVAFSLKELYALAGRLRTLRGGTAVVLGALSPRTRNAQVALFQSGEVDYLVATDAIGMGLNLDLSHVAFASLRKFDGRGARALDEAELAQIAGRAGRFTRDGTFGTVLPLELDRALAARVEAHRFEPVRRVRYRNSDLDFSSTEALIASLRAPRAGPFLSSVSAADDLRALEKLSGQPLIAEELDDAELLRLLWDVCQIPDFRKILFEVHVDLLKLIFLELRGGALGDAFLGPAIEELDRTDGDVDTLTARIARLRTWAFVANQSGWVRHAEAWQSRLRDVEDRLSDALHLSLVERFVERRARVRPVARAASRARRAPEAVVASDAFHPFASLGLLRERLVPAIAAPEAVELELEKLIEAEHTAFVLEDDGRISASTLPLARLVRGASINAPEIRLVELDHVGAGLRQRLQRRLFAFARDVVSRLLEPLRELTRSELAPLRAIAYQLERGLGTAAAAELASSLAVLGAPEKELMARHGIRVGELSVYVPQLLRPPALRTRALLLRAFEPGANVPPDLGRPTQPIGTLAAPAWRALGHVVLGPRAFRADLAERPAALLAQSQADGVPPDALHGVLSSLGVPRAERGRVLRALTAASTLPARSARDLPR